MTKVKRQLFDELVKQINDFSKTKVTWHKNAHGYYLQENGYQISDSLPQKEFEVWLTAYLRGLNMSYLFYGVALKEVTNGLREDEVKELPSINSISSSKKWDIVNAVVRVNKIWYSNR